MKAAIVLATFAALVSAGPMIKRQSFPTQETYDDGNALVDYWPAGSWTHLTNQGSIVKNGTESYSKDPSAGFSFPAGAYSGVTNLTFWAGKKWDRGNFVVYLNGQDWDGNDFERYIGSGSQYDANAKDETQTQIVFQQDGIDVDGQNVRFNIYGKGGPGPFFAVDEVVKEYYAP